jgi:hypothetical protein
MVYEKNKKMDEATWNSTDIVKFNVAIPDTITGYNYYINIRNTTDYGFANLFMFVKMFTPTAKFLWIRLNVILPTFRDAGLEKVRDESLITGYFFARAFAFRKREFIRLNTNRECVLTSFTE